MSVNNIFHIKYPTGRTEIYVGEFFGTADVKRRNKLLKLARRYCSDTQREKLLTTLEYEKKRREKALKELETLRAEMFDRITKFFYSIDIQPTSYEKAIRKQKEKISQSIKILEKERWYDDASSIY